MYIKTTCRMLLLPLLLVGTILVRCRPAVANDFVHPAARLMEIEQKAMAHDSTVRQNMALQEDVERLQSALSAAQSQLHDAKTRYNPGRLLDLERKALSYAYLNEALEQQNEKIAELERQLAEEKYLTTIQAQEVERLKRRLQQVASNESAMKEQIVRLRETIDQLRMGNYEFYEVKAGDTLESIAELPMIYGDASKANQIRQANVRRIPDLDNLSVGDVLVIPRFQASGRYEF